MIAAVVPLIIINAQAVLSAGPDQQVKTGETVVFNGTTTENVTSITQVTWDFGDNSTIVNGTSPDLLNATHTYTAAGVYNATLTVKFDSTLNQTETDIATITVSDNQPPIADAGPDQSVEQTSAQGANVTLNGAGSGDPDNDTLTYSWNWTGGSASGVSPTVMLSPGITNITLTVSDGEFNSTDTVSIIVGDTTPPSVDAGEDMIVEATSPDGAEVTLYGKATDDVDMDLDYMWSEGDAVVGTEANLTITLSLGSHILTLNATDDSGNVGTDNVAIEAVDTTPPEINVTVNPDIVWPPNHKYVDVETVVTVHDAVDPSPTLTLVSVTSSEPDNGKGDGNTTNDIVILGDNMFRLRAERSGMGQGRIYTITYRATDASGNSAETSITITVPHNK
jgi:PKD repeat protein